jgi:hypothetical protein
MHTRLTAGAALHVLQVRDYVMEHCEADGWTNGLTGELLTPQTVCMYDITRCAAIPI